MTVEVSGWERNIPASARGEAALSFWDVTWSGATAYADGTAYADMTDSASAITTAITKAKSLGVPVRGTGRFRVESTVTIDCDADFTGAEFVCSDTAIAPLLRVGTTSSVTADQVKWLTISLPDCIQDAKALGAGWTGASVGVEVCNLSRCEVYLGRIVGFVTGLLLTTAGANGVAYNGFHGGHLDNNKVNCHLKPVIASGTGWVNENTFAGVSHSHESAEGAAVAGTRHVLLSAVSGGQPNNNLWVRCSLESPGATAVVESIVESVGGIYNRWLGCRWEATPANVSWNQLDATYYSRDNAIVGGYGPQSIVFTVSANSQRNDLDTTLFSVKTGATLPAYRFGNPTSDVGPQIEGVDLSTSVLGAGSSDWRWRLTAAALALKAKADTVARLSMSTALGVLSWGSGSATADTNLYRNGANFLKTDDQFFAADGIVTKGVAHAVTDADLTVVTNNALVIDTANNRIYVRVGGTWRYAALT